MKTELEIQRAHDILVEIILKRVPNPFPGAEQFIIANADVLCWILNHDHNTTFRDNLAKIETYLEHQGLILYQAPEQFTDDTHPLGPNPNFPK